ncbi:DivIVA domain-containing protein [Lactobacillus kefiranofaciens]|uniref:DivIVA domain-containing protein n=1 Tax=Lactobacillus kefiranofaciens TaxID=267818 RepID=UPI001FBBFE6F|nr:DivIVA domain-containing protein [Lactobacillus kefiranofaciens]MCJ2171938.1 DivIVA domain-containing protein [Lactobacillus kefiranofaciens]
MADKETQLTPMDIHNKEFKSRGRNGYDRYDVDSFLDQIVDDYGDALDQVVDLKNEIVSLNEKMGHLQEQVDEYNDKKKSLNKTMISVQEMKEQAKSVLDDARKQAVTDTDYQRQQKDVIESDYKRLKKQIGEFRSHMQAMLQEEIDNLNDDEWQHALDKYFHTERFYPGGGAEPLSSATDDDDEEEDLDLDDEDIDIDDENDVNSSQDPDDTDEVDDEEENKPKPLTGDSPSHETVNTTPNTEDKLGPTIVFPDDYKK